HTSGFNIDSAALNSVIGVPASSVPCLQVKGPSTFLSVLVQRPQQPDEFITKDCHAVWVLVQDHPKFLDGRIVDDVSSPDWFGICPVQKLLCKFVYCIRSTALDGLAEFAFRFLLHLLSDNLVKSSFAQLRFISCCRVNLQAFERLHGLLNCRRLH